MKNSSLVSRSSSLRPLTLLVVVLAGLFAGCTGNDYGSSSSSASFSYGVGVYDSWGYYGNPYYGGGGAVIVTPPYHPSRPVARPRMR